MYQVYLKNAIVLQLIAGILYVVLSLSLSKHTIVQTLPFDLGFGLATFLVSSLLAFWGFHHYRERR